MNNLTQLLREADPLRHEVSRLDAERDRLRSVVTAARPGATSPSPSRRALFPRVAALVAVGTMTLVLARVSDVLWMTPVAAQVRFEVRLAEDRPAPGLVVAQVENAGRLVYLHPEAVVNNEDIATAAVVNRTPGFAVEVQLRASGADRLRQATSTHVGRPVAILLEGRLVMAPTVRSAIGDSAVITGALTESEARRIADGVRRR